MAWLAAATLATASAVTQGVPVPPVQTAVGPVGVPVPPAQTAVGLVNAPVAPEAVYVGRVGAASVIDLDGLGQGTGDLRTSRWPLNPNFGQPGVQPPLNVGRGPVDAGGAGLFTLTLDTLGSSELLRQEVVAVDDIHIGQPLDLVFNAEHRNSRTRNNQVNPATFTLMRGNTISVAPHPNPPRLDFVNPTAADVGIWGEEPTVTTSGVVPGRVTTTAPPALPSPINLLVLGTRYPGTFVGPQPPPPSPPPPPAYTPYTSRQQIGHFLYIVDRAQRRVLVVNSNRFTLLQSFALPDPFSAALSPNLRWLAVSNFAQGTVSFIDVDPLSPSFHRVLGELPVGRGPKGLAWQPEGEDLLVCNSLDNTVTILSATNFQVRKVLRNGIAAPSEVAVVARQTGVGLATFTYFALVQNGDGTLAGYESGPVPFGADDSAPLQLGITTATVVKARLSSVVPEFFVAHRDPFGLGQVSVVAVGLNGTQRTWSVTQRYGGLNATTSVDLFSGNAIVDLAVDEIYNDGATADVPSLLPGLTYARHSGKGQLKQTPTGPIPAHRSRMLFVACADVGRVDVMEIDTGNRWFSIAVPGVRCLSHYWRQ